MTWGTLLVLGASGLGGTLSGCVQTLDFAGAALGDGDGLADDADQLCGPGFRVNPDHGACAPCAVLGDPQELCPCGFRPEAAPFPFCDSPLAFYVCLRPCRGKLEVCTAYRAEDQSIRECSQFRTCCDDLAMDSSSTPCCAGGTTLICELNSGGLEPLAFRCVGNTCCESSCVEDQDCDTLFQSCTNGRCTPGCNPDNEFCAGDEGACTCQVASDPL